MLDTILDLFDRRRKGGTTDRDRDHGSGGLLGRLGGLVGGDHDDDRRHRGDVGTRRGDDGWRDGDDDDDGNDRGRRRSGRRDDGFDFG